MFLTYSHPCEVTEVLDGVKFDVDVDMLSDMEIAVMLTLEITLEFLVGIAYAVDVLTDLLNNLSAVLIVVVSTADVVILADENFNDLAAVMTTLELIPLGFTLSAPWEESISFCWAVFSC